MGSSKKTKVVFIHPDLGIGGAERLVLDVGVALAKEGNDVTFVTNHFDKTHAFQELQSNTFKVQVIGDWIPRSICGVCQALCAYIRMIYLSLVYILFFQKADKPDVYFIDQIPMAVPFIKLAGGKVVYYCHHPDLLASPPGGILKKLYRAPINWLELRGTALADMILVNSKYTASVFQKTFPQIKKDIQILYPTISSSYQELLTQDQTKPNEIEVPSDKKIFLSINRYHPAKKLELALNAFVALKSKLSSNDWDKVHLIIAGGYDPNSMINATYFTKLVDLCQANNLVTKVTFLKSPTDSTKATLLKTCDCLIYTPVNEHFGIVPLEAMSAGKPVIACNSGGPCETVLHEITGFLCDPTPDSLADAMSKILNEYDAQQMGILGRERLEKYFSYNSFALRVNEVISCIIAGKAIAPLETEKIEENVSSPKIKVTPITPEKPVSDEVNELEDAKGEDQITAESQENENQTELCSTPVSVTDTMYFSPYNTSQPTEDFDSDDSASNLSP